MVSSVLHGMLSESVDVVWMNADLLGFTHLLSQQNVYCSS